MNHDEKFEQRWDFRRRDDDRDSSDDSQSNSGGNLKDKKPKLITDLVILDDNEVSDTPGKIDTNDVVQFKTVEASKKKAKPSTKKNAVKNKPKECLKEKKSKTRNRNSKDVGNLEDLKMFADSLIRELKVARQKLSARFWEEMKKLVAPKSVLGQTTKEKVKRPQKKKDRLENGTKSTKKPQDFSGGPKEKNVKTKVASKTSKTSKRNRVVEKTTTNAPPECENETPSKKVRNTLGDGSDQTISLPYLTLPNVVPIPQPQIQKHSIPLSDSVLTGVSGINSGSEKETGKLMDPKSYYHGVPVPVFQPQLFGSFSNISCKSVDFLNQNCCETTNVGAIFPTPRLQGLGGVSDPSSQACTENAFQDNSTIGLRMNANFPAFSQSILPNNIRNDAHNASGEFVSLRLRDMKDGQFYLRNNSKVESNK